MQFEYQTTLFPRWNNYFHIYCHCHGSGTRGILPNDPTPCFSESKLFGCFFHLSKNYIRKKRTDRHKEEYKKYELVLVLKNLPALAFEKGIGTSYD